MAVDIGPRIGIDGEKEFRQNLANINQQLRTLGSEMQAVTSQFDANDRSQEALAAQTNVLNRQIDAQQQKLQQLQHGLEESTRLYGENDTRTLRWAQAVNEAQAGLNRMQTQLGTLNGDLDDTSDSLDEAADASEGLGGKFSSLTVAAGNLISSGIKALISSVGNMVSTIWNMDEATEEFRSAMAKLDSAYEYAGMSADGAREAYYGFYEILGDTDTAVEASQLLAQIVDNQRDIVDWTDIAAGVFGRFGDSIPIESLIEASNETIRVGQVTGTLADALNWVGISEDEFNEKLAACTNEAERNRLVTKTLYETYGDSASVFYQNNMALVKARDAQAELAEATEELGTTISTVKTELTAQYMPTLTSLIGLLNGFLTGNLSFSQAMSQLGETAGQFLQQVGQSVAQMLPSLTQIGASIVSMAPQMLQGGVELVGQLVSGVVSAIPTAVEALGELITELLAFLTESGPDLIKQGAQILLDLASGIVEAIPDLVAQLPEILSAIIEFVPTMLPEIAKQGARIIVELAAGIIGSLPELLSQLPKVAETLLEGLSSLPDVVVEIGASILEGIWEGIQNTAGWLVDKLSSWADSIMQDVKDFFGIHSPSTVFRDEVGVQLGRGVAEGLDDSITYVTEAADRIGEAVEAKILETQEALEREQTDLVKETLNTQLEALETFRDEYTDALDDLRSRQQSMTDLLAGYGDLFTWTETEAGDVFDLGSLQSQINAIREYGSALENLKARGTSESLLNEIVGLSVDDATAYTKKLLSMTDEEYSSYIALWEEKQALAADIAKTFYSSELASIEAEFVDKIPESLSSLKDELVSVGANCALGLAEGFQSESNAIQEAFVSTTQDALTAAEQAMGVHSPSTVWAGFGRNLALGLDEGFLTAMEDVSSKMQRAIPTPTIDSIQDATAGAVNGLSAIMGNQRIVVEVPVIINGKELYRATLDDLRAVQKANPEVAKA